MNKDEVVYQSCLLLIEHFERFRQYNEVTTIRDYGRVGFSSRVFEHILHPQKYFVAGGQSVRLGDENPYPEHVVPCALMQNKCIDMLKDGHDKADIAKLLQKHWKVAHITHDEAHRLDHELGLKADMPEGWSFENGDTFARLDAAGIELMEMTVPS